MTSESIIDAHQEEILPPYIMKIGKDSHGCPFSFDLLNIFWLYFHGAGLQPLGSTSDYTSGNNTSFSVQRHAREVQMDIGMDQKYFFF